MKIKVIYSLTGEGKRSGTILVYPTLRDYFGMRSKAWNTFRDTLRARSGFQGWDTLSKTVPCSHVDVDEARIQAFSYAQEYTAIQHAIRRMPKDFHLKG